MVPIKIDVNVVSSDNTEVYCYVLRIFGCTIFRKEVVSNYPDGKGQTVGFNVMPDLRQYVDDNDEE